MTSEVFENIVKQIVADMDHADDGSQIRTYGLVDLSPDLTGQSFGYTYEDYRAGYFYSRDWVVSGADPNEIKGAFPALFLDPMGNSLADVSDANVSHQYGVVLVDKVQCDDCPGTLTRTGPRIYAQLVATARAVLAELSSYARYALGDSETVWLSEGRADHLAAQGVVLNEEVRIWNYLSESRVDIRPWGDYPNLRGVMFQVSLVNCEQPDRAYNYELPALAELALNRASC